MGARRLPDVIDPEWKQAGRSPAAWCCRALLHLSGWRLVIAIPRVPKAVVVFYPHTSNWDFVIGLLARFGSGVPASWAGKDNLFRWPLSGLWRRLGGIPVNRREHTGFVAQMAAEFAQRPEMLLAIAPEGTRRLTPYWKSGFYRTALAAKVPLALAFIDFSRREIGVGAMLELTGDADTDMASLRAFYSTKVGRYPEKAGPIALRPPDAPT